MKLQKEIQTRATYDHIKGELLAFTVILTEIKNAIIGDFDKPGLINKHANLENRVTKLEGRM